MDSPLMRFRVPLILFLCTVTGLLGTAFFYTAVPQFRESIDRYLYGIVVRQHADWTSLDGTIVLSLTTTASELPRMYSLRPGKSKLGRPEEAYQYYAPRFSPDESYTAYSVQNGDTLELVVGPNERDTTDRVIVSTESMHTALFPSWSPDGNQIAFMARTKPEGDDTDVESWGIYAADPFLTASARYITDGMHPVFASNESLIVLKRDGLYRYTEAEGVWSGERAIPSRGGQSAPTMQLDISTDGNLLVLTNPEHATVDTFELDEYNGIFEIRKIDEFPITGYWPVISPDRRYIALEVVESVEVPTDQRLTVLDRVTGESVALVDLMPYEQSSIHISDWIEGVTEMNDNAAPAAGVPRTYALKSKQGAGMLENFGVLYPPVRSLAGRGVLEYRAPALTATPLRVRRNRDAVIAWDTGNRDQCTISSTDGHRIPEQSLFSFNPIQWIRDPLAERDSIQRTGTLSVSVDKETTFTLVCNDPGRTGGEVGAVSRSLVVRMLSAH